MIRILTTAYNNSDYLTDTDFIILNLTDKDIEQIKDIQSRLHDSFPIEHAEVHLYNIDFEVYSNDTDEFHLSKEIIDYLQIPFSYDKPEYIILKDVDFKYDDIPNSEVQNDVRLDTYMLKVYKDTIRCVCYTKYSREEIYSDEIDITEL